MNLRLIAMLLLVNSYAFGQDVFPGTDTSILSGAHLKVKPKSATLQIYGYEGFFKDEKYRKVYECCDSYNAKYSSLVEKEFKVISITPWDNGTFKQRFKLKLNNSETGDIYFDYDPRYEHLWPFQFVGDIQLPKDFYCRGIEMIADKFTGDTTYTTKTDDGIAFEKIKKGKNTVYYLAITETGSTLTIGKKGLILLLENGKRIEKPDAELSVKPSKYSGYIYSAFVELDANDLKLLTGNAITDDRLYIYDGEIKKGKILIEYLNCLLSK